MTIIELLEEIFKQPINSTKSTEAKIFLIIYKQFDTKNIFSMQGDIRRVVYYVKSPVFRELTRKYNEFSNEV